MTPSAELVSTLCGFYLLWVAAGFMVAALGRPWWEYYLQRLFGVPHERDLQAFAATFPRLFFWPLILYRARREYWAEVVAAKLQDRAPFGPHYPNSNVVFGQIDPKVVAAWSKQMRQSMQQTSALHKLFTKMTDEQLAAMGIEKLRK